MINEDVVEIRMRHRTAVGEMSTDYNICISVDVKTIIQHPYFLRHALEEAELRLVKGMEKHKL